VLGGWSSWWWGWGGGGGGGGGGSGLSILLMLFVGEIGQQIPRKGTPNCRICARNGDIEQQQASDGRTGGL